jgi:hypothetical protein
MSAFTEEQLRLVSQTFSSLFNVAKFEALTADGQKAAGNVDITTIRCRIPLDSGRSMIEAALGVGGTDYQLNAVAVLKLFLELKPAEAVAPSEFGWHLADSSELDFLDYAYSLYWYKPNGERQGGIQISLWIKGGEGHMSLRKPTKARAAAPAAAPASPEATDSPWGGK